MPALGVEDMEINRITVRIIGDDYLISGRDEPARLREVAEDVQNRLDGIALGNQKLAKTQLVMLVALRLAEELSNLRKEHEEILHLIEEAK